MAKAGLAPEPLPPPVPYDILFASIQTLSQRRHLHRFGPRDFDYLVLDEFHHPAAQSYRRLIGYFEPRFLLGLTATPQRTDGAPARSKPRPGWRKEASKRPQAGSKLPEVMLRIPTGIALHWGPPRRAGPG